MGLTGPDRAAVRLPHLSSFTQLREGHGDTWNEYLGLTGWWLDKMAATSTPLREQLTLLLHGQFPTGMSKVGLPILMHRQNGISDERDRLVRDPHPGAVEGSRDADLARHLSPTNRDALSNENFARELMERFTMGIGTYSQRDVELVGPGVHRLVHLAFGTLRRERMGARLRRIDFSRLPRRPAGRRHRPDRDELSGLGAVGFPPGCGPSSPTP